VRWCICTVALAAVIGVLMPGEAAAAVNQNIGYDVSYPQCGKPLPASPGFGIVGVNNGVVFSTNPCIATEYQWAQQAANHAPQFYANTGNPGPKFSSHWPAGQQTPRACPASGPNSQACSYDYGWNAAKQSFEAAAFTAGTGPAAAARWWLDVETGNSWQTLEPEYGQTLASKRNDTAALSGAVAALKDEGVKVVGFYSTSFQWTQITGGSSVVGTRFAHNPNWLAGYSGKASAQAACGAASFTGGPVRLTQYPSDGFDADWRCPTT
jgi:hypothetical protein